MTDPAGHLVYIWSAYGATALAIGLLVIRAVLDGRAQTRALERLTAPGADRRDGPHA